MIARRLAHSPAILGQLRVAIAIFGHRAAALATLGRPRPFADLGHELQDRMLARWASSRVPLQRTIVQALRKIVLTTYYGEADAAAEIGYVGPLHTRAPEFAWEGPAKGVTSDAEPIARAAGADDAVRVLQLASSPAAPRARLGAVEGHQLAGDLRLSAIGASRSSKSAGA